MFVVGDGVSVYSVTGDGKGLRHLIPSSRVRLVEEVMSIDVFVEQLENAEVAAEGGEPPRHAPPDDDDDNGDEAPHGATESAPVAAEAPSADPPAAAAEAAQSTASPS